MIVFCCCFCFYRNMFCICVVCICYIRSRVVCASYTNTTVYILIQVFYTQGVQCIFIYVGCCYFCKLCVAQPMSVLLYLSVCHAVCVLDPLSSFREATDSKHRSMCHARHRHTVFDAICTYYYYYFYCCYMLLQMLKMPCIYTQNKTITSRSRTHTQTHIHESSPLLL